MKRNNWLKCVYVVLNRNFHSNVNVLGRFHKQFLTLLYRSTLFDIFLKPLEAKIFASWTKATLLRIYFRNLSVQRSVLQYKRQSLKKVNEKYVINRLWHGIFHIITWHFSYCHWYQPEIPISARQRCGDRYWLHK